MVHAAARLRRAHALATLALTSALLALAGGAASAQAQTGGFAGHPMPGGPRPLHALVRASDAAAIGTIDAVETGRIRVKDAIPLFGDPPARFELKRAPSSPPSLETGQRVVLLLAGARSPYLVVGGPREQITLAGDAAQARLASALAALRAALDDEVALRDLYLAWSDGDDPTLRPLAVAALVAPDAPFAPLPEALAAPRARAALDPGVETSRRVDAAAIALLAPSGVEVLLARAPEPGDAAGLQVYELALAGGLLRDRRDAVEAGLVRGLASPDAAVRRVALRYARALPTPRLRAAIAPLAAGDPDPALRRAAADALGVPGGGGA